jgi:hypothetical protein
VLIHFTYYLNTYKQTKITILSNFKPVAIFFKFDFNLDDKLFALAFEGKAYNFENTLTMSNVKMYREIQYFLR